MATELEGEVVQANNHVFLVNLATRTCTCGHFEENSIPCRHAFSLIRQLPNRSPRDYVPLFFTVTTSSARPNFRREIC
jgi:hypothetical protein